MQMKFSWTSAVDKGYDNNDKHYREIKKLINCFILLLTFLIITWQTVKDSSHSTKIALAVKKSRGASIKGLVKDWKKKYLTMLQSICDDYIFKQW